MPKKILLIVEGETDEPKFFRQLFDKCQKRTEFEFVSYRNNIHQLAQELQKNYPNFEEEDISISLILASLTKDSNDRRVLFDKYTDIYLVFDFDPHHNKTCFDMIRRMLIYFNDSTSQGKLYINYPMMQSYKHFSKLPDKNYSFLKVDYEEIISYKNMIEKCSAYKDLSKYDSILFYDIALHNLRKVNYLVNGTDTIPTHEEYLRLDMVKLFDNEVKLFSAEQQVAVINTCIFALCDYAPKAFFDFVNRKKSMFHI